MNITIHPGTLCGSVKAIPSKSQAHRLLICAAFADGATTLLCPQTNKDIAATADCLNALGAKISRTAEGYHVVPIENPPKKADLYCAESGSTLRFLLPIAAALGVDATFHPEGRLGQRPLSPLWEEMERMGCKLSRPTEQTIRCCGKLAPGEYRISGGVSSQFITGLLFALSLLDSGSRIEILGKLESAPYVKMTQLAMSCFGVDSTGYRLSGGQRYHSPGRLEVEGDWSNAAFFLGARALGSKLEVTNLGMDSPQGDRAVWELLNQLSENLVIDASNIPDLVPILSVVAAGKQGAVFTNTARLRLKESDRVESVIALLRSLGGKAESDENTLTVHAAPFTGGIVDAVNDHRIAMAAAVAATCCRRDVTILGAECVSKSYPDFWEEYRRLGGNYEQYVR